LFGNPQQANAWVFWNHLCAETLRAAADRVGSPPSLEATMPNPQSTAKIAGHPLHPMLVPFPIAFFVATLGADLMYLGGGDVFWFRASEWLLGAGVVMALLAALAGVTDVLGDARIRALTIAWVHFLGNLLAVLIEAFNWYRRYSVGQDAVRPTGLYLSIAAVLILLVTGWLGWEMVYRRRVGIA
jgi:uncharacterized membrane protein